MSEAPHRHGGRPNQSAGHISVHVAGAHPPDTLFLFERHSRRQGGAFAASFLINGGLILLAFAGYQSGVVPQLMDNRPISEIVWLSEPGPGGGGGGGGNEMEEPPAKAELPGKDDITVPVEKPPPVEIPKEPQPEPDPIEQLTIPAATLASAAESMPGLIQAPPSLPTISQGSGRGGGAGTGSGVGVGPGQGSGLGPGFGGGTGGGAYKPGSGVSNPVKLREVRPQYTPDAMRAKVQGSVLLRCIVRTDGTVGDVEVLRSLDATFGLDQEAVKAARQWVFRPGMLKGQPVPVEITIELTFTLR